MMCIQTKLKPGGLDGHGFLVQKLRDCGPGSYFYFTYAGIVGTYIGTYNL
jgi:hypothetical protein